MHIFVAFKRFQNVEMYLGIFGVLCIINCDFECVYRIRCLFLYIGTYLKYIFLRFSKNVPEVWTFFVRIIFEIFVHFWCPKWSPPIPIPSVNVKVPLGGENMKTHTFLLFLLWFLWKIEKTWKNKWIIYIVVL